MYVKQKTRLQYHTPAEKMFKSKHDQTLQLMDQMNQNKPLATFDDLKSQFKGQNERRLTSTQGGIQMGSSGGPGRQFKTEQSLISQSTHGGGNIHNSINVAINYTVHQGMHTIDSTKSAAAMARSKNGQRKGRKSQERLQEQEMMNSSFTGMLDRQLLLINNANDQDAKALKISKEPDSLTQQIFHGDKIYLKNGSMAFKPLGMETVIEQNDEQKLASEVFQREKTEAVRHKRRLATQTTEQNIQMQQQLDFATAEDLLTFSRDNKVRHQSQLTDDYRTIQSPPDIATTKVQLSKKASLSQSQFKVLPQSKSAQKELRMISRASLGKGDSKSSLKTVSVVSPTKKVMPDESRQVHPGLQKMNFRIKASTINPGSQTQFQTAGEASDFTSVLQNLMHNGHPVVHFDESNEEPITRGHEVLTLKSQETGCSGITGGDASHPFTATRQKRLAPETVKNLIGPKLHRQGTGNSKAVSRALREMRYHNENQEDLKDEQEIEDGIKVDTEIRQPIPVANHKRIKTHGALELKNKLQPMTEGHVLETSDRISKLAIDYSMHLKNQQRIKQLMFLISKGDKNSKKNQATNQQLSELDIDVGDSISNLDAASYVQDNSNKPAQLLPMIVDQSTQSRSGGAEPPLSTQPDSNTRKVADTQQNQAQLEKVSEADMASYQNGKDSGLDAYSSINNVNGSMLNASILMTEVHGRNLQPSGQGRYGRDASSSANGNPKSTVQFANRKDHIYFIQSPTSIPDQGGNTHDSKRKRRYLNMASAMGQKLNQPKYRVMRSSMFTKKPLEQPFAPENDSEYSVGHKSYFEQQRFGPIENSDANYLTQGRELAQLPTSIPQRSFSQRKLMPLGNVAKTLKSDLRKGVLGDKRDSRAQSLQFSKGLTFVMVKGRVQPSEQYIYKNMLPYTNAQKFQSLQVKSSQNRHSVVLPKMPTHQVQTQTNMNLVNKGKGKKLKVGKMRRREITKTGFGSALTSLPASKRNKTIMEQQQEDGSDQDAADDNDMTWQEYQDENQQLKEQLRNQIAIFEQYLKVAVLQQKARDKEQAEEAQTHGKRHHSMDTQFLLNESNFEIDRAQANSSVTKSAARPYKNSRRKNKSSMMIKDQGHIRANSLESVGGMPRVEIYMQTGSPKKKRFTRKNSSVSRRSFGSRKGSTSRSPVPFGNSIDNQSIGFQSKQSSIDSQEGSHPTTLKKVTYQGSRISKERLRALEYLDTTNLDLKIAHETTHTVHKNWVAKIQTLRQKLDKHRNDEVVALQDEIRKNKRHIQELTRENLFELDVNYHDQKLLLKTKGRHVKNKKKISKLSQEQAILALQNQVRVEMARKMEFNTWGFHNYIIEYRIKVRMTEDLIDCAQRLTVQADAKTQRELALLKLLRDRTYDDLRYFVRTREQRPWRNWDRRGFYYKPMLEDKDLTLKQVTERVDSHLLMIAYLEPRYQQLIKEIPPYNSLNAEMIQFCSDVFGNEGWLQLFSLKQLRKAQEQEHKARQYMPPVEHIKRFEVDPYTLQIEQDSKKINDIESASRSDEPEIDMSESLAKHQPSAWELRKPDVATQGTLKTGYEPLIKKRNTDAIYIQEIDSLESSVVNKSEQGERNLQQDVLKNNHSMAVEDGQEPLVESDKNLINSAKFLSEGAGLGANNFILVEKNATPAKQLVNAAGATVSGTEVNRFDGDVVAHLKDQVEDWDKEVQQKEHEEEIQRSNWLQVLERERIEKEEREAAERRARAARLASLFEEEDVLSQDDEDLLDAVAAKQDIGSFMEKIDNHLQVEKKLLEAWTDNDKSNLPSKPAKEGPQLGTEQGPQESEVKR